jgi:hypothetical protein
LYVCIFHICMFQKMQRAWTVCIPSGICFIEQKGTSREPVIFWAESVWVGCDGTIWLSPSESAFPYKSRCSLSTTTRHQE